MSRAGRQDGHSPLEAFTTMKVDSTVLLRRLEFASEGAEKVFQCFSLGQMENWIK